MMLVPASQDGVLARACGSGDIIRLRVGLQYFSSVGRLLQQSSAAYLKTMRQAAAGAGK